MRRTLAVLALAASLLCWTKTDADWPRYNGPKGDGHAEGSIARQWPKSGPKLLWQADLGVGYGGAAIAGDEVYVLDRVDQAKNVLRRFDLNSGKEVWSRAWDAPGRLSYDGSRSTPTIGPERVYCFGPFGGLHAFDRKSGEEVWGKNLKEDYKVEAIPHRWGFAQSPLLAEKRVIVAPAISRRIGVAAFDAASGKELWNNTELRGQTYVSPMLHTIAGVEQILAMAPRLLIALDPKTGKTLWRFKGYKNPIPIPVATPCGQDRLFVTGGYNSGSVMIQVSKNASGFAIKELFRLKAGAQIHPAILVDEHLYVNLNENANLRSAPPNLACLSLDGKTQWTSAQGPALGRGGLLAADGLLLALGGQSGILHLFEPGPSGLKELARSQIFKPRKQNFMWAPLALSEGRLLIRDQRSLKCLDLRGENKGG